MGAIRCPDCGKFATIDADHIPTLELALDRKTGKVVGNSRLVNCCKDCGKEVAQHFFPVEFDFSELIEKHDCPNIDTGIGWQIVADIQRTLEERPPKATIRAKFHGIIVEATLTCNCEEKVSETKTFKGEIKTSLMEALV
jgi:hypothetical protein